MSRPIANLDQLRARKHAVKQEIAEVEQAFMERVDRVAAPVEAVSNIFRSNNSLFQQITSGSTVNVAVNAISVGVRLFKLLKSLNVRRKHKRRD